MTRIFFIENITFGDLSDAWYKPLGFALSGYGIFEDQKTYAAANYTARWI